MQQPPTPPNMFVARISGPLEKFSIVVLIFGLLFKLQSWPYASELLLTGSVGLALAYMVLLPIRLNALKPILPRNDYLYAMAATVSLGLFIGSTVFILTLSLLSAYTSIFAVLDILRNIGLVGVAATFVYDLIRTHPEPNTAQFMIAVWLRKRQTFIMVLIVIGLFFRFLF